MVGKKLGFSDYELTTAKKQAKREKFLAEMQAVVPWQALIDLIEPYYPKASKKGGRLRWTGFSGQVPSLAFEAGYRP